MIKLTSNTRSDQQQETSVPNVTLDDYTLENACANAIFHINNICIAFSEDGDNKNELQILTAAANADLASEKSWKKTVLSKDLIGYAANTKVAPVMVSVDESVYVFWADNKASRAMATRYNPINPMWSAYVELLTPSSSNLAADNDDATISVLYYGDTMIVSKADMNKQTVTFYFFNPDDYDENENTWQTIKKLSFENQKMEDNFNTKEGDDPENLDKTTSMACFSTILSDGTDPSSFIVQSLNYNENYYSFNWQLTLDGSNNVGIQASSYDNWGNGNYYKHGINLVREPGGRIRAYYRNLDKHIQTRFLSAVTKTSGQPDFKWSDNSYINGVETGSYRCPAACYIPGKPSSNAGDKSIPMQALIIYSNNSSHHPYIEYKLSDYGTLRIITSGDNKVDLTALSRNDPATNGKLGKLQVLGYIDGPPPVPNSNYGTWSNPSNNLIATINYGEDQSRMVKREMDDIHTIAVQSSAGASFGVGASIGYSIAGSSGEYIGHSQTVRVGLDMKGEYLLDPRTNNISPYGTLSARNIVLQAYEYQFIDVGATAPDTDTTVQFAKVILGNWEKQSIPFEVFSVKPGDLSSYSEASWDKAFGENYFEDEIEPNAVTLNAGGNDDKYLPFSTSTTGSTTSEFGASTGSFEESSWTYDASVYSSVTAGVNFFGVGLQSEIKGTIQATYKTKTLTSKNTPWGINADIVYFDNNGDPNQVASYTWRLYLVKASTAWTEELISNLPPGSNLQKAIDPQSACWKIIYTVDTNSIIYNSDLTERLAEQFEISQQTLDQLEKAGITRVGQLITELDIHSFENLD